MKIFMVDKYKKHMALVKSITNAGYENVEIKDGCDFKATKNDFIIFVTDGQSDANISKLARVVVITKYNDINNIWKFANEFNCVDIIDEALEESYIASRIIRSL